MMTINCPRPFWRLSVAVLLIGIFAGCGAMKVDQRRQFACGTVSLPPGYYLREDRNLDTPVATGLLGSRRTNIQISYSCGGVVGVVPSPLGGADPALLRARNYRVLWSRQSGEGKLRKVATLAEDRRLKTMELYISFPNAGPVNFVATISSDDDVAEVERVIGTFEPKTSASRD